MSWNADRAENRIRDLIDKVPSMEIVVRDFEQYYSDRRAVLAEMRKDAGEAPAILQVPRNSAITTNAAHVYANLMDFNDHLTEAGAGETEASHTKALQFLHFHYSACDQLIRSFDIQRVDFHGSRLHAVVLTPLGAENEQARLEKAMSFAAGFRDLVERAVADFGADFSTRVRIGIDSGPAVAIDSGRGDEREPLFIGSPANHAAKLAVGDEDGVFLSPRALSILHGPEVAPFTFDRLSETIERAYLARSVEVAGSVFEADERVTAAYSDFSEEFSSVAKGAGFRTDASFNFHHHTPPLRSIVFSDHPPSNAIRMEMASLFADIDNFTAYIDNAIQKGQVAEAVANLYVLRGEMAAVLRDDFDGRKVRFIGDCIHGVVAEGDNRSVDAADTVRTAVLTAAGIRSSFDLCKEMLSGIEALKLAIGIEFGSTPICRIGLRGDASVRCATSRSTCVSEQMQTDHCDGDQTALGEVAFQVADIDVRRAFGSSKVLVQLDYPAAEALFEGLPSPYVHTPDPEPVRAHCD